MPAPPPALPAEALGRRRQRVSSLLIGLGATVVLGSVAVLPAIPWAMGIVKDVKHVYIPSIPTDNTGAYLVTDQGVMQLFTWYVEPDDFPEDAPTIPAATLHSIAAVQKQHDVIENYQLWNVDTIQLIPWVSWNDEDGYRTLDLPSPLPPGSYMFVLPSDSMYGGATWHFFKVQ